MDKDSILIACATNDEKHLVNEHFGEAGYFMIFRMDREKWEHIETIPNKVAGEHDHEDPGWPGHHRHRHGHGPGLGQGMGHGEGPKARAILDHFRERKVDVFMSRQFGPNIVIVRQYVLPVVIRHIEKVEEALQLCRENYQQIIQQLNVPAEERKHIVLS